jgi:hypothetical protein
VSTASNEFAIVAACARWPPSDARHDAIRTAAHRQLDWARVVELITWHRVAGLAYHGLTRASIDVPAGVASRLREMAGEIAQQNLALTAEMRRLDRALIGRGVLAGFMKGLPLALVAYGDIAVKMSRDLDLVVDEDSVDAAAACLAELGYARTVPPPDLDDARFRRYRQRSKELVFVHAATRTVTELHWRLTDTAHRMPLDIAGWPMVTLPGGCRVRALAGDDLFLYLCVHGAAHAWFRLKWLADVAAMLSQAAPTEIERLYRVAVARGTGLCVAQALLLCRRYFDSPIPGSLVDEWRRSRRLRWLEEFAARAMVSSRPIEQQRLGTTRLAGSRLLLGRGWHHYRTEFQFLSRNLDDMIAVPLPERLHFLYPFVRLPRFVWRHLR